MPRNMSFAHTVEQFLNRTKDVTRRDGWEFLIGGELLQGCRKCMGLKPGEKIRRLGLIRVGEGLAKPRREPLQAMLDNLDYGFTETTREGFSAGHEKHDPRRFVEFYCDTFRVLPRKVLTRIEYRYL